MAAQRTWRTSWPVVGFGVLFVLMFLGLAAVDRSYAEHFRRHRDVAEARVVEARSGRGGTTVEVEYRSVQGKKRHANLEYAVHGYREGETMAIWYSDHSGDAVVDRAAGNPVDLYNGSVLKDLICAGISILVAAAGYLAPANLRRLDRRDARRGHWRQAQPGARHG